MATQLLSKASFAARAGKARSTITSACRTLLKGAMVGKSIDAGHPEAIAYLAKEGIAKPPPVRGRKAGKEKRKREVPPDSTEHTLAVPKDIRVYLGWPLGKLLERFGTDERFLDFLGAAQKIEMIHHRRLANAQIERTLVNRKMVQECILDVIDGTHLALLSDGAKTIAGGAMAKAASGTEQAEVERYVHDVISSHLKKLQSNLARALAEY